MPFLLLFIFFFFNDTATTEIYTLSLHDALPISDLLEHVERLLEIRLSLAREPHDQVRRERHLRHRVADLTRSEEHTSELQSQSNLVCRLLLEKKKKKNTTVILTKIDYRHK